MNIFLKSLTIMLNFIAGLPAMEKENTGLRNCAPKVAAKFLREVVDDPEINLFKTFQLLREIRIEEHDLPQDISHLLLTLVAATSLGNWSSEDMLKSTKNLNYAFFTSIISIRYPGNEMLLEWSKVDQEACFRFLSGKLIYRPTEGSDEGMIELKVSGLWNPLEGTFNLSQCGDTGKHLSISTGYRKVKKAENANKVEIWFTPKFLVRKELNTTAGHFKGIFPSKWNAGASVGMFWTWGEWDNLGWYDYLTSESRDNLSKINLFDNWNKSRGSRMAWERGSFVRLRDGLHEHTRSISCFVCELK